MTEALDVPASVFDDQAGDGSRGDDAARTRQIRADRSGCCEIHSGVQDHGGVVAGRHDGVPARAIDQDLPCFTPRASITEPRSCIRRRGPLPGAVAAAIHRQHRSPIPADGRSGASAVSSPMVGRLVEIWSGQPLGGFFASEIFQPLGMTDTTFWVSPERGGAAHDPLRGRSEWPDEGEDVPFTVRPALLERGEPGLISLPTSSVSARCC